MGPYYRGTSQGIGSVLDTFYQHPILMLILLCATIGAAAWVWRRKTPD
ncbi:MAG: hypothetical protein RL563_1061 [Pseudomonadota bacterium]|jgi:hypothetical protein